VTDGSGAGRVTVKAPIQGNSTGAWVILDRPSEHSQTPAELYTSTFVASL
jgi:hypothetical protein